MHQPTHAPICAGRALLIAVLLAAAFPLAGRPAPVAAQDGRALVFFEPVEGALNDTTPAETWTWTGYAGQVVSLLAVTISGDLDPVLELVGPDDAQVARNDDLDSLVTDAGLEAFALPEAGTYTVRVSRYQGEDGTTAGRYRLTITPGFAQVARQETFSQGGEAISWLTPQGQPVALTQGQLQLRPSQPGTPVFAYPPEPAAYDEFYLQAEARLFGSTRYAEIGLAFRVQARPARAYQFKINTAGEWTALYQDDSGQFALRTWMPDPVLDGTTWTLAVSARGEELSFFANGTRLSTVFDGRLTEPGNIGLLVSTEAGQATTPTVLFDNVLVTTRLGTTYTGMPLALTATNFGAPQEVVAELVEAGQIVPSAEHDLFLFEKSMTGEDRDALFELLGTDQAQYDNFLFGAGIAIAGNETDTGCGLVFRWQDEDDLSLAYIDNRGGFAVVEARDGALTTNAYDLDPAVNPAGTDLLVIVQGDRVTLYANGALVAQETVTDRAGRVGVALLNYTAAPVACLWSNIWLWPLVE